MAVKIFKTSGALSLFTAIFITGPNGENLKSIQISLTNGFTLFIY